MSNNFDTDKVFINNKAFYKLSMMLKENNNYLTNLIYNYAEQNITKKMDKDKFFNNSLSLFF